MLATVCDAARDDDAQVAAASPRRAQLVRRVHWRVAFPAPDPRQGRRARGPDEREAHPVLLGQSLLRGGAGARAQQTPEQHRDDARRAGPRFTAYTCFCSLLPLALGNASSRATRYRSLRSRTTW